ncbi:MAG TPA: SpoIIE family protein phosphatase [Actinomycetota bacterium]|nr:SpoIIE family protein phosphatase [Actinomycetota bacterium]
MMLSRDRQAVTKGSWRWAVHIAELTAWGTVLLILAILQLPELSSTQYRNGLILSGLLAVWLLLFFRVFLFKALDKRWFPWAGVFVNVAFACGFYGLFRTDVPGIQLIFIPVILASGLLGTVFKALAAAVLAVGGYLSISAITGFLPDLVPGAITSGVFLLSGAVAGLLAGELRTHFRGEKREHQLATAVRHRLLAVLDAVDEAIVFRDRQGIARVINQRAGQLFEIEPDHFLGEPVVELLRTVARLTEEPEDFMETFQQLRDEPDAELRLRIEQILPTRRKLRMYSAPAFDEVGALVGRIDVFTDVTDAAARAEEVQQLYEAARKTAESYQRALLPDKVPTLPRVSLVANYVAAAGSRAVCGDFYDFVTLRDGRMAIVLGDVCGIGPVAANDAALTRYTLRSLAASDSDAGSLLRSINDLVHAQSTTERFTRILLGVLDPERAVLEYANAGHVPPILYRCSRGEAEWLAEGGLPLGIEDGTDYKVARIELEPGDMIVFYTDGLTEAPRHGRPFGQAKFADLVTEYGVGTPGELVQALRRAVDMWVSDELRDDLAIVVCQVVPDATLQEPSRELVLPNEPMRVPEMRSFVAAFLADIRAPIDVSSEILLAAGEAAANAYRHGRRAEGRSEVRLQCNFDGSEVSITVADDGPGFDPTRLQDADLPDRFAAGGRGLYLMRELMDDVRVDTSSGGTSVTMTRVLGGPPT